MVKVFSGYSEDMAINPNNLNKIFVAGQAMSGSKYIPAIHKTTDGGNNWTKRNLISKSGSAYSVTIDPVNNNIIYAGGGEWENYKSILYKSLNGGNDWTKIGGNITGYIYDIAVDPVSPSKVYAATSSGVYKSTNSGASWTKTSLSGSINCIKVYPKNPKIVFAGGRYGVHYSNDRGNTWVEANKGLAVPDVKCLDWNLKKRIIYAGTYGGSVYWNKKLLKKIK